MNAEGRAENFMQVRDFCIVCRATAETYPAPQGWRKWASTDGGVYHFYMFSTCPHCSQGITERHRISALDELSERLESLSSEGHTGPDSVRHDVGDASETGEGRIARLLAENQSLSERVRRASEHLRDFKATGEYEFIVQTAPEAFLQQTIKDFLADLVEILSDSPKKD
jgi:hypothetical protein